MYSTGCDCVQANPSPKLQDAVTAALEANQARAVLVSNAFFSAFVFCFGVGFL